MGYTTTGECDQLAQEKKKVAGPADGEIANSLARSFLSLFFIYFIFFVHVIDMGKCRKNMKRGGGYIYKIKKERERENRLYRKCQARRLVVGLKQPATTTLPRSLSKELDVFERHQLYYLYSEKSRRTSDCHRRYRNEMNAIRVDCHLTFSYR